MFKSFLLMSFLAVSAVTSARTVNSGIDSLLLSVDYIDPKLGERPIKKSPIQIPLVYQDCNTLTFATPCTGCTLQLLDSDGEVVYETTVAPDTTTVALPASLSGTYELRLIYGDIYFYGDIML